MTRQLLIFSLTFFAMTNFANAHPGHGSVSSDAGLMHYLTSPMHVGSGLLVALIAVAAIKLIKASGSEADDQK